MPLRAFAMEFSEISVAKTWIFKSDALSAIYSCRHIAMEYGSSPVEHPATQIRMGIDSSLSFKRRGKTISHRTSKVLESRKNSVTGINKSWYKTSCSDLFSLI